MQERRPTIALAGASGYVGGRLLERLEAAGFPVRCLARRPENLAGRVASTTTVVRGDCLEAQTLEPLLRDVDCAFYLVHSMGSNGNFARQDREAALNFARVARKAGVRRIVYLGGLGDASEELSRHLKSRHETGEALRSEGVASRSDIPRGCQTLAGGQRSATTGNLELPASITFPGPSQTTRSVSEGRNSGRVGGSSPPASRTFRRAGPGPCPGAST